MVAIGTINFNTSFILNFFQFKNILINIIILVCVDLYLKINTKIILEKYSLKNSINSNIRVIKEWKSV